MDFIIRTEKRESSWNSMGFVGDSSRLTLVSSQQHLHLNWLCSLSLSSEQQETCIQGMHFSAIYFIHLHLYLSDILISKYLKLHQNCLSHRHRSPSH